MTIPAWQTVPMPANVEQLPRTDSGMPVVYVTDYVSPDEDTAIQETGRGPIFACPCTYGVGRPAIGRQCPTRQRQVMMEARCSVCGIPLEDQHVFIGPYLTAHALWDFDLQWVTVEGAAHPICAAYSIRTCPKLLRSLGSCQLIVAQPGDYSLFNRIATGAHLDNSLYYQFAPVDEDWHRVGVLMLVAAVFVPEKVRTLTLAEWMETQG